MLRFIWTTTMSDDQPGQDERWWKYEGTWVICETCQANNAVAVRSVPGIPYSAAYCDACLRAGAHPWWLIVGNTADLGGLDGAASWWCGVVTDTILHLGKTIDQFNADVAQVIADEEAEARRPMCPHCYIPLENNDCPDCSFCAG